MCTDKSARTCSKVTVGFSSLLLLGLTALVEKWPPVPCLGSLQVALWVDMTGASALAPQPLSAGRQPARARVAHVSAPFNTQA